MVRTATTRSRGANGRLLPGALTPVCSAPGCDRAHYCKGFCTTHYQRMKRYGSLEPKQRFGDVVEGPSTCQAPGCTAPRRSRRTRWCSTHHTRMAKHGRLESRRKLWDGTCTVCGASDVSKTSRLCLIHMREKTREYRRNNLDAARAATRRSAKKLYRQLRDDALARYGAVCACCGECSKEFLCIDHVGGGGNAHRRALHKSNKSNQVGSAAVYRWLRDNAWPSGFRVLCHNCNFAEANGGCPHRVQGGVDEHG